MRVCWREGGRNCHPRISSSHNDNDINNAQDTRLTGQAIKTRSRIQRMPKIGFFAMVAAFSVSGLWDWCWFESIRHEIRGRLVACTSSRMLV